MRVDSLRGFVREGFGELLHLDSRALRTLRDLLFRPGRLTAAYFAGHRVRYLSAIQLYLIAAALFFFANSWSPFISVDRETWVVESRLGIMTVGSDEQRPTGTTAAFYEERLRATANNQLPAFLIGVVVVFGALVALAYPRRERNLLKHLVFALHFTAFYLVLLIVERVVWRIPVLAHGVALFTLLASLAWLAVALKRTYGERWSIVLPKALALFIGFNLLLILWVGGVLAWALRTL